MNTPTTPDPAHPLPPELPVRQFARLLEALLAPLAMLIFSRMHRIGPWAIPLMTRMTRARHRLIRIFDRIDAISARATPCAATGLSSGI